MSNKSIITMAMVLMFVMVNPSYGLSDNLEKMNMDDLTKFELRLKKVLTIRKLEADITNALKKSDKQKTPDKSKGVLGGDSTAFAPTNILQKADPVPMPVLPKSVEPKVSTPVPVKRKYKLKSLPKIVSIKGTVDLLYAQLEVGNSGTINVKKGDKILDNVYTVSSIDFTGVTVKDKKGKTRPLSFKPFEHVTRPTDNAADTTQSQRRSNQIGEDSTHMPPLPN